MAGNLDGQYHGDGPLGDRSLPRKSSDYIRGLLEGPRTTSGWPQNPPHPNTSEVGRFLRKRHVRRHRPPQIRIAWRLVPTLEVFGQPLGHQKPTVSAGLNTTEMSEEPILRPMAVANRRMAGWTSGFLGGIALPSGVDYLEAEGHRLRISQPLQSGDRAPQRRRPCQMSQWLKRVQLLEATHCIRSCSIFSG